jgi:hypothetical protein
MGPSISLLCWPAGEHVGGSVADKFLFCSLEDQTRARPFAETFEVRGFRVWWDVGLRTGEAHDEATETALRTAKAVVVLWSQKSAQSRWVRQCDAGGPAQNPRTPHA